MAKKEKEQEEKGLSDYGIIYISGSINDGMSESICKEIIEYNIKGEADHLQMIINSPGGSCPAGFAIIDMMDGPAYLSTQPGCSLVQMLTWQRWLYATSLPAV